MKTRMEVEIEEDRGLYLAEPLFELFDGEPDQLVEALSSGTILLLRHRDGRRAKVDLALLAHQWATA